MILGRQEYEDLLLQVLAFLSESFGILIAVICLIWSLMWLRDAGLSARLAAIAFGLQLLMRLADAARTYLLSDSWTFYTPYSAQSQPSFWSAAGWIALLVTGWMISASLLLAALITAWRKQHRSSQSF